MRRRHVEIDGEWARIPDKDAYAWIKTLQQNGFSMKEIDTVMNRLNDTYFIQKNGTQLKELFGRISKNDTPTLEEVEALRRLLGNIDETE